ncbi:hypothetical protein DSD19_04530 [Rhodovulum sp. BSW8]|uniref:tail fiber domain-containing protein n=1 Tax=Rhodovulum sp. BSW8 TaxID=2259645 RepID=UPI000DE579E0|nr:tail fiber domain-containing protein [Rhodovulum sp. BSW8]RBO54648.1 hypothetical protein DSD19_04530 [Rhodovulum sp. BSW8]
MSGGGSSAPDPDPNIGKAAMMSAELGQDYFAWMKDQAKTPNAWAKEDRARYTSKFLPLQDAYIEKAQAGPDYAGVEGDVRRARADATVGFENAQGQESRRLAAMGVNPASGRFGEATRRSELTQALGTIGAGNATRLASRASAEAEADVRESNAINLGSGLAVNPATSIGLSTGAMSSGVSGAMQGYGQQGQLLNQDYQNRVSAWSANQASQDSMWGGLGSIAGFMMSNPAILSSRDYKTNKRPARGILEQVREMPVEEWSYKEGIADGGPHVGPYAEDFHAATGKGDGRSIPVVDAIGISIGGVQELDRRLRRLARSISAADGGARSGTAPTPKGISGAAA